MRNHLSVESLGLLANNDYDDDDSDQEFLDTLTARHASDDSPSIDSTSPVPPLPSSSKHSDNSCVDTYNEEDTINRPLGSYEVSVELEVAQNYADKEFTRQEQSVANLLSLFTSTGCRLSLFDEVFSLIKKDVKQGNLDLDKVSTRKTFLSRLRLKFPDIAISSTAVPFPSKKGILQGSLLYMFSIF